MHAFLLTYAKSNVEFRPLPIYKYHITKVIKYHKAKKKINPYLARRGERNNKANIIPRIHNNAVSRLYDLVSVFFV